MKQRGILKLSTYQLIPHPENPRKDLGDLTEMSESIKKHGILQNLTVVPVDRDGNDTDTDNADRYMVIIGHRRLAAAKAAGIDQIPCRIVEGMTHDEQLLTMLEENMQRSDLTVYDQAQGFQLMLDLGQTVEDIEEKSGFSKTTIYHRLNIAKLDKETLKEKQDSDSFQLSLTDLIELEKIKDIDKRNEILKKARNSSELKYMAKSEAERIEKEETFEKIITILKGLGVSEIPKGKYYWQCDKVLSIKLSEYGKKEIDIAKGEELYYYKGWDEVSVYAPRKQEPQQAKTPETEAYDKLQKVREQVREANKRLNAVRQQAFEDIALGNLEAECKEEIAGKALWQALISVGTTADLEEMTELWMRINGLDDAEDPEEAEEAFNDCMAEVFELPFSKQCALILSDSYIKSPVNEYLESYYDPEIAEVLETVDTALRNYGFVDSGKDMYTANGALVKALQEAKQN